MNAPALLFPAISLLLLAYTNRFLTLAAIVRQLSERATNSDKQKENLLKQIQNITQRIELIRWMQAFGILSITLCTIDMFIIFAGNQTLAKLIFGVSLICMILSLLISLWETIVSGEALRLELSRLSEERQ